MFKALFWTFFVAALPYYFYQKTTSFDEEEEVTVEDARAFSSVGVGKQAKKEEKETKRDKVRKKFAMFLARGGLRKGYQQENAKAYKAKVFNKKTGKQVESDIPDEQGMTKRRRAFLQAKRKKKAKLQNLAERSREYWKGLKNQQAQRIQKQKALNRHPSAQRVIGSRAGSGSPLVFGSENIQDNSTEIIEWSNLRSQFLGDYSSIDFLAMWDSGFVFPHEDFLQDVKNIESGTVFLMDYAADAKNSIFSNHATHVAGILVGQGRTDLTAQGMVPSATLRAYDFINHTQEMIDAVDLDGVLLSNHSYGLKSGWSPLDPDSEGCDIKEWIWYGDSFVSPYQDDKLGQYNALAREFDSISYFSPNYTIVKSAGNERGCRNLGPQGEDTTHTCYDLKSKSLKSDCTTRRYADGKGEEQWDTLEPLATAKNAIVVGAIDSISETLTEQAGPFTLANFSSIGPTDDGRIKPDIVAPGVGILSTTFVQGQSNENQSSYKAMEGTSMATPLVTGGLAYLIKTYQDLFNATPPLSSTLRALLIHTARPYYSEGGPSYKYGWGLVDFKQAYNLLKRDNGTGNIISEDLLLAGEVKRFTLAPDVTTEDLKVTLAWIDPPGRVGPPALNAGLRTLTNDLDIRLFDEENKVVHSFTLNPEDPSLPPTQEGNHLDNVEQIWIPRSAFSGEVITLEISHKGANLVGGEQVYSLIIEGFDFIQKAKEKAGVSVFEAESGSLVYNSSAHVVQFDKIEEPTHLIKEFRVENSGEVPFEVTRVLLNNHDFEIESFVPGGIGPGEVRTFKLKIHKLTPGIKNAIVNIETTLGTAEGDIYFSLQAELKEGKTLEKLKAHFQKDQ